MTAPRAARRQAARALAQARDELERLRLELDHLEGRAGPSPCTHCPRILPEPARLGFWAGLSGSLRRGASRIAALLTRGNALQRACRVPPSLPDDREVGAATAKQGFPNPRPFRFSTIRDLGAPGAGCGGHP